MSKTERKNKHWIKYAGGLAAVFLAVFIISTSKASAAPDPTIYYQGKLTNTSDVAVADASYDFKFRIYDAATDGNCLWSAQGDCSTPTAKSVAVSKGVFSTALGEAGDNALDLDFNSNYWLEVTVGSDTAMDPRKKINAAGYALNSTRLDGGTWEEPGTIGATTPNSAAFTTLDSSEAINLATGAGSAVTIGNSTGTATLASGGASSWANTSGDLTISTATSGTLALTSAGDLNLSGTSLVVDTSATSDTINIEQGTYDSILSFTQPGAATQTYTFATGGTVATSANKLSVFAATTSAELSGVLTDENTSGGYMTDVMTTAGDLIYAGASGVPARLAGSGTDNWILKYDTDTSVPYWAAESGGAGPFTDGTDITYLTDVTNEDFAIGNSAYADAIFGVDVDNNTVRIGSSVTTNGILNMYASDDDTGSITYNTSDTWAFSGGNINLADDMLFTLGTTGDLAMFNRSTTLTANTTLAGVFVGTPVVPAIDVANTTILSNITTDADMVFAVNSGGNSKELLRLDGSAASVAIGTGSTAMSIDTNGNVGIGDMTPDGLLDVEPTGVVAAASYGINLSNLTTNSTTAANKYGVYITSTGTFDGGGNATNNYGLYVAAPAGADNNYAAVFDGKIGIIESTGATYHTFFQGGDQAGDLTYTLPTGYAGVNGYVLSSTTGGVMSWIAAGGGHTQNTDTGTTGVSFIIGSATNSTTTDTTLQFGSTGAETLVFDGDSTDNFLLSDDLYITGNVSISAAGSFTSAGAVTLSSNGTNAVTIDPTGAGSVVLGSADVTGINFTTDNNAANDFNFTGSADFSGTLTAGSSNVQVTDAAGKVQHDSVVDCADTQILKWATAGGWGCAADATSAGGGGANTDLSNLASVAINTSLLPGTNDSIDLGDNTHRFANLYLGGETIHIGTSTNDEATIGYTTSTNILNFATDSTSNGDISFFTDDLYLDKATGYVGIGTTGPGHLLDVAGNVGLSASSYINFGATDGTSGYGIRDNSGTIQFKSSGGTWKDIASTGTVSLIQASHNADQASQASMTDINFNTEIISEQGSDLSHDTSSNSDNFTINTTGIYYIYYYLASDTADNNTAMQAQVRVDDTSVITGSAARQNTSTSGNSIQHSFIASLTATDFITLQALRAGGENWDANEIYMVIYRLNLNVGSDLAEWYETETGVEAGDVVALSPGGESAEKQTAFHDSFVLKKAVLGDDLIGIVSTAPNKVMGEEIIGWAENPRPIALSGRVPVKVTSENGSIKPGDLLTSSSTPGIAMHATKAGAIIGQAMTGFDMEGEGMVVAFIKTGYANGSGLDDIILNLTDSGNLPVEIGEKALKQFVIQKEETRNADNISEIITDRLAAGLEIITPKVTTQELAVDKINAALGSNISVQLADNGGLKIDNTAGETGITFDAHGNGTFKGTLTADMIVANKILGLEVYTSQLSGIDESVAALSSKLDGLEVATEASLDLSALGILEKKGGLVIAKETIFKEATIFEKLVTLLGNVIFHGTVSFEKTPTFNQDMGGHATVKEGDQYVVVTFDQEYAAPPIVNATLSLQTIEDPEVRAAAEELLLVSNVKYIITNVTTQGFEIKIDSQAMSDIPFAWTALAVKDAQTFVSDDATNIEPLPAEENSSGVSIDPTPLETAPVETPTGSISNTGTPVTPATPAPNAAISAPAGLNPAGASVTLRDN